MNSSGLVELAVYDLSRGMAKQFISSYLGIDVEAIYHTGVRVYGYEYFFSDGIQKMKPEEVVLRFGMEPFEITPIGETELPEELIDCFIEDNKTRYTSETYDLLHHNCNNFSEEFVNFLCGCSIPEKILELPNRLISTPLGQKVAPMLERMGATKAIPLATGSDSQSSTIPSTSTNQQSQDLSLSSIDLWGTYPIQSILVHLQQIQYTMKSERVQSIIKLCYLLHRKNQQQQPCFIALQHSIDFLSTYQPDETPALFDFFYLLGKNLPFIVSHCAEVKQKVYTLLSQFCTSILTILLQSINSPFLVVFTYCLYSLSTTPYQSELYTNSLLPSLVQIISNSINSSNEYFYSTCYLLLSIIASVLPSHQEDEDPSDVVLILLNTLADNICEETNKKTFAIRVIGLYYIVTKGNSVEKITAQSQGICSDSTIQVMEYKDIWDKLVKVCEQSFVCYMSLGFLTESALIPKKSKEIKVDPSSVVGLKAIIAEKERLQEQEELDSNPRKRTRKITNPKVKKSDNRNPGIEERIRRDEEEKENNSMKMKLQKLEEKSKRFHQMQKGEIIATEDNSNVDFKRRKEMYDFYGVEMSDEEIEEEDKKDKIKEEEDEREKYLEMMKIPHKDDELLIEDEFGRIRWVKHGSDEHMRNIGSSYRIRQLLQGKSFSTPVTKKKMSHAARVKMTWENQLNKSEREYFTEIDKETEEIRNKKSENASTPSMKTPILQKSKDEIAEDLLRNLL